MTSVRLRASGVGIRRQGRWIVSEVSLEVVSGQFTSLVGPNGSGKSTLIRLLAGIWRPDAGTVRLDDRELHTLRRAVVASQIACVPQDAHLAHDFPVRDIVAMGRYCLRGRFQRETREDAEAVDDAMRQADIAGIRDRAVNQISGGERRRVLIARALATGARVLILDEPTANLDVDHSLEVLGLCRALAGDGRAVLLATHDLNAAFSFTDQAAVIDSGRVVAVGRPERVLSDATLRRTFHVDPEVVRSADGTPALVLRRITERLPGARSEEGTKTC